MGKMHAGDDKEAGDDDKSSNTDSESKTDWQVLLAKLVTAYKVINGNNTIIGRLGFAILISDPKKELKMILYKSKIDLLSTLVVREACKIFQKGNFIQYLDQHQNFWSVLFESESDRDEALRLLEERCPIQRDVMETSINASSTVEDENESEVTAKGEGEVETSDKACETDPEEKQTKQLKVGFVS